MKTVQLNHAFDFHLRIRPQLFLYSHQSLSHVLIVIINDPNHLPMGRGFIQVYEVKILAHLQFQYFLPALSPILLQNLPTVSFLKY